MSNDLPSSDRNIPFLGPDPGAAAVSAPATGIAPEHPASAPVLSADEFGNSWSADSDGNVTVVDGAGSITRFSADGSSADTFLSGGTALHVDSDGTWTYTDPIGGHGTWSDRDQQWISFNPALHGSRWDHDTDTGALIERDSPHPTRPQGIWLSADGHTTVTEINGNLFAQSGNEYGLRLGGAAAAQARIFPNAWLDVSHEVFIQAQALNRQLESDHSTPELAANLAYADAINSLTMRFGEVYLVIAEKFAGRAFGGPVGLAFEFVMNVIRMNAALNHATTLEERLLILTEAYDPGILISGGHVDAHSPRIDAHDHVQDMHSSHSPPQHVSTDSPLPTRGEHSTTNHDMVPVRVDPAIPRESSAAPAGSAHSPEHWGDLDPLVAFLSKHPNVVKRLTDDRPPLPGRDVTWSIDEARGYANKQAADHRRATGMTDSDVQAGHTAAARHAPESGIREEDWDQQLMMHLHSRRAPNLEVSVELPEGIKQTRTRHTAQEGLINDSVERSRDAQGALTPRGHLDAADDVHWRTENTPWDQRNIEEIRAGGRAEPEVGPAVNPATGAVVKPDALSKGRDAHANPVDPPGGGKITTASELEQSPPASTTTIEALTAQHETIPKATAASVTDAPATAYGLASDKAGFNSQVDTARVGMSDEPRDQRDGEEARAGDSAEPEAGPAANPATGEAAKPDALSKGRDAHANPVDPPVGGKTTTATELEQTPHVSTTSTGPSMARHETARSAEAGVEKSPAGYLEVLTAKGLERVPYYDHPLQEAPAPGPGDDVYGPPAPPLTVDQNATAKASDVTSERAGGQTPPSWHPPQSLQIPIDVSNDPAFGTRPTPEVTPLSAAVAPASAYDLASDEAGINAQVDADRVGMSNEQLGRSDPIPDGFYGGADVLPRAVDWSRVDDSVDTGLGHSSADGLWSIGLPDAPGWVDPSSAPGGPGLLGAAGEVGLPDAPGGDPAVDGGFSSPEHDAMRPDEHIAQPAQQSQVEHPEGPP